MAIPCRRVGMGYYCSGVSNPVVRPCTHLGKLYVLSEYDGQCLLVLLTTHSFCLTEFALMTSRRQGTSILNHPHCISYLIHIQTTSLVLVRDLSVPELFAQSTRSTCSSTARLPLTGLHLTRVKHQRRDILIHTSGSARSPLIVANARHSPGIYW